MPSKPSRLNYYRRIFSAYLGNSKSQLTFWHETPEVNAEFLPGAMGAHYMTFAQKADYIGALDETGIPMLDYRGVLARQYNPIAIAQFGLGNHNLSACNGGSLTQSEVSKRGPLARLIYAPKSGWAMGMEMAGCSICSTSVGFVAEDCFSSAGGN
jgi:hypothetical protein